jgi:uncharacterized membrane protein YfcA
VLTPLLLSGLVVLITHTLEAITGFGCTALAMPFVTALLGIQMGVKSLTVIAWLLAVYIVIRNHKDINFKQFFIICSGMLLGLPVGMYIFRTFNNENLKIFLAIFICIVSVYQLVMMFINKEDQSKEDVKPLNRLQKVLYFVLLFFGGIVHGIFSSGGPIVVLYAKQQLKDKKSFRATLCLLWATLNTIIIATYFIEGSFDATTAIVTAELIPFLLAGIFFGNILHEKVNERVFSFLVFSMLLITGLFMLFFR